MSTCWSWWLATSNATQRQSENFSRLAEMDDPWDLTSEVMPSQSGCSASLALVCIKQNRPQVLQLTFYYRGSSSFIGADFRLQWDYLFIAALAEHLLNVQWNKSLAPPAGAVSGHRCSQCLCTVIPTGLCFLHPIPPPPWSSFYYTALWENREPLAT